jgi:surface antigen
MKKFLFLMCVLLGAINFSEGQNPFSATVLTTKNSTSPYATTKNAFHTNTCTTGNQDLHGQCTWYVEGRIQELGAAGKITTASADNVHNSLCGATGRHATNWDLIIPGAWHNTATQALPTASRKPGMIVMWDQAAGVNGHVAFVEEVSADKTTYRISEFNVTHLAYSTKWLTFGSDTRGFGVSPKFFLLETATAAQEPTLVAPVANALDLATNISFNWSCPNATEYRLQIIEASAMTGFSATTGFSGTMVYNQNVGNVQSKSWTASANKIYYWTVRGYNTAGTSTFAPYRKFSTAALLSVTPNTQSVAYTANTTNFNVTGSNWTVTANQTWATVTKNGNTLPVTCQTNPYTTARTVSIVVYSGNQSKTVAVTQAAAPANLTVTPSSLSFTSASGSKTIGVESNVATSISSNQTWLTVSPTSGAANTSMSVTARATANTLSTARSATITIKGGGLTKTISVTQNKKGSIVDEQSLAKETELTKTDATTDFVLETVYPNPVSNELSIVLNSNELQEVTMEIRTMDGKRVEVHKRALTVGENRFQLPVAHLANGFYVLTAFKGENQAATAQVLKFEVLK